ncbi:hypothetical protein P9112_000552 [Eukaryota sp. TZLM1-RC]
MFHCYYLFNRKGKCLFYREWNRTHQALDPVEDQHLMFDFINAIKTGVSLGAPVQTDTFSVVKTCSYCMHHYESATGYHVIVITDPNTTSISPLTTSSFEDLFLNFVVKNPSWTPQSVITEEIAPSFIKKLDELFHNS